MGKLKIVRKPIINSQERFKPFNAPGCRSLENQSYEFEGTYQLSTLLRTDGSLLDWPDCQVFDATIPTGPRRMMPMRLEGLDAPGLIYRATRPIVEAGGNITRADFSLQGYDHVADRMRFGMEIEVEVPEEHENLYADMTKYAEPDDQFVVFSPFDSAISVGFDHSVAPAEACPQGQMLVIALASVDATGLLMEVTFLVADCGANVVRAAAHSHCGIFLITLMVLGKTEALARLHDRLTQPDLVDKFAPMFAQPLKRKSPPAGNLNYFQVVGHFDPETSVLPTIFRAKSLDRICPLEAPFEEVSRRMGGDIYRHVRFGLPKSFDARKLQAEWRQSRMLRDLGELDSISESDLPPYILSAYDPFAGFLRVRWS